MLENMQFYKFMHRQVLVLLILFSTTSLSYVLFGFIYKTNNVEILWYLFVLLISYWGYTLYNQYSEVDLTIEEKEEWLRKLRYFIFVYFSTWTIMFVFYTMSDNIKLHYLAIFTQLGVAVVATTILVSEKKLAFYILTTSMLPITIYLFMIGEFYSYVIGVLTIVLSWVLLYGSRNTYNYLLKSGFQSYHDYLTKLGNRRYFTNVLEDAIKVQKNGDKFMYLLLIDLDHFKTINDTLGHDIGDVLLIKAAKRMKRLSKEENCSISRLGGDEFCILSSSFKDKKKCLIKAKEVAKNLLSDIKRIYIIEEHHLYISASIGLSIIDNPHMTANTFIKEADIAMYEAKAVGRDGIIIFNEELSLRVERKLKIESLLHFALERDEITLHFQPQLNTDEKVTGFEVLMRWNNGECGFIGPDEFIPIAEQTGVIIELGYYVLEEAFKTLKEISEKGIDVGQMAINISMRQMFQSSFIKDVEALCDKYLYKNLRDKLVFEITETSVAEDVDQLISTMNELKKLGIKFSMDDFGTGYSSLSYLGQIPIDELKIDKSFILALEENKSIVKTILNITKNLGISSVAEGVENKVQCDFLKEQKCDVLQGYLFSKPVDKENLIKYLLDK